MTLLYVLIYLYDLWCLNNYGSKKHFRYCLVQVKKLVQENRLMRCGYSPAELPSSSVNGGLDDVSTSGDSRGPSSSSDLLSKAGSSSFMDAAGQTRLPRWSMIEQGDTKRQLQCQAVSFRIMLVAVWVIYVCSSRSSVNYWAISF